SPALLVVRAGSRVVALSGKEGKPLWDCTGAGKPVAVAWTPARPQVIYDVGGEVTACRLTQAANTADDEPLVRGFEPYRPRAEGRWGGGREPSRPPAEEAPRVVEPLPWVPLGTLPPLLPSSPAGLLAALLGVTLAVLVLPGALLVLALRRGVWGLCGLAVPW